jgi:hypothetical protein
VDRDSAHLVEIAKTVSAALSREGHAIEVRPVPREHLERRRRDGNHLLMIDWVSQIGPEPRAVEIALLTAVDSRLARRPPRSEARSAAEVARSLPLGVIGALAVSGAVAPRVRDLQRWDLASAWVSPP